MASNPGSDPGKTEICLEISLSPSIPPFLPEKKSIQLKTEKFGSENCPETVSSLRFQLKVNTY